MAANSAPKVSASFRYGISSIDESTRFKVLNAAQYMAYAKEAWVNGGNKAAAFPFQDNDLNTYSTTDTDWHDQYFGVGNNILANVSISSGGKTSSSYFSASYYKEKGSVKAIPSSVFPPG
jgi:hypothetical protein